MKIRVMSKMDSLPGPRYRSQGPGSGEEFRDDHLVKAYDRAVAQDETLWVDMDGAKYGYPTSFLEETFGGLARLRGISKVEARLKVRSVTEPLLQEEVMHYVVHAEDERMPPFEPLEVPA